MDVRSSFDNKAIYQIQVLGILAASWSDRLEGMAISVTESGDASAVTTLVGELPDQAALTGVLNTLYDLHLTLLLVERQADMPQDFTPYISY